MISKEAGITRDEFLHREELKRFWNTETGLEVLSQRILLSGLLSEIRADSDVIAHNLCIRELEEMGILDEEGLKPLLRYMLSQVYKRPAEGE